MGSKLLWIGLTIIVALPKFIGTIGLDIIGAALMIAGAILITLDR
jgi:hypothetical protein